MSGASRADPISLDGGGRHDPQQVQWSARSIVAEYSNTLDMPAGRCFGAMWRSVVRSAAELDVR